MSPADAKHERQPGSGTRSMMLVVPDRPVEWQPINDGVMGGLSRSRFTATADGRGLFEGEVSLANNGGFASVRTNIGPLDLSEYEGIALRVRGDGKRYRLRLHDDSGLDTIAYQACFDTDADQWIETRLSFRLFQPTFRGRRPGNAPPLDTAGIRQLGLMIADRQAGPFRLEVDWIGAFRNTQGAGGN